MNNLYLYTLSGCPTCKKIKDLLIESGIQYIEISCTNIDNNDLCNDLEAFANCSVYPMVSYKTDILICITDDYNKLGKILQQDDKKIIYCHSIFSMLDIVKKLLD